MKTLEKPLPRHKVVSREEWIKTRKAHLEREKELTRELDKLSRERRDLPWVKVDKNYVFDTLEGKKALAELFRNNSQLIVYHFMFGPEWKEGCPHCSFLVDPVEGINVHLAHHDVSFTAVSRAPLAKIEAYKKRMGWTFDWVSSNGSDFNFDYHVSFRKEDRIKGKVYYNYELGDWYELDELPGVSVFYKDAAGDVFHTYSSYTRGLDLLIGAHNFLDLTPKGRNEKGPMDWVRRHDSYGD